jgi:nitrite reductase (NADH) small subunit
VIRVCSVEDVPLGEGRSVLAGGRRVAVFRAEDGWFALDAQCPHRGGPLADGIVARRTVICPLHERRFDLVTGQECVGGYRVAAHRVVVRGDEVYLTADVPFSVHANVDEHPPAAAVCDPERQPASTWKVSAMRSKSGARVVK